QARCAEREGPAVPQNETGKRAATRARTIRGSRGRGISEALKRAKYELNLDVCQKSGVRGWWWGDWAEGMIQIDHADSINLPSRKTDSMMLRRSRFTGPGPGSDRARPESL